MVLQTFPIGKVCKMRLHEKTRRSEFFRASLFTATSRGGLERGGGTLRPLPLLCESDTS